MEYVWYVWQLLDVTQLLSLWYYVVYVCVWPPVEWGYLNQYLTARLISCSWYQYLLSSIRKMVIFPATLIWPNRFGCGISQKWCHFSETTYQPILALQIHPLNGHHTPPDSSHQPLPGEMLAKGSTWAGPQQTSPQGEADVRSLEGYDVRWGGWICNANIGWYVVSEKWHHFWEIPQPNLLGQIKVAGKIPIFLILPSRYWY